MTFFAVPLVFSGMSEQGAAGVTFTVIVLGGLVIVIPMLLKSVMLAALVFFPLFVILSRFIWTAVAYILCAVVAAFLSSKGAFMINVDVIPPTIDINFSTSEFANFIGVIASSFALLVSSLQMASGVRDV